MMTPNARTQPMPNTNKYCAALCPLVLFAALVATQAQAQFTTVLNIPPEPNVIRSRLVLGSNSQLNLFEGGVVQGRNQAGASDGSSENIEINISGGSLEIEAYDSKLNISGGSIGFRSAATRSELYITGGSFDADYVANESIVNISGGVINRDFLAKNVSVVNFSGGTVAAGALLTVEDNSELNVSAGDLDGARLSDNSVLSITGGTVGGISLEDSIANISGGSVGVFSVHDSVINITGGSVSQEGHWYGTKVNISGGGDRRRFSSRHDKSLRRIRRGWVRRFLKRRQLIRGRLSA